jgi:predicted nucleotidyltransferase
VNPLELLEEKRSEIDRICRRFCVKRLRLFGSALNEGWDAGRSDLDFLVEYRPDSSSLPALDRLVGLQLALSDLLGLPVDVVNWATARNPYFRESAERFTHEIYAD